MHLKTQPPMDSLPGVVSNTYPILPIPFIHLMHQHTPTHQYDGAWIVRKFGVNVIESQPGRGVNTSADEEIIVRWFGFGIPVMKGESVNNDLESREHGGLLEYIRVAPAKMLPSP